MERNKSKAIDGILLFLGLTLIAVIAVIVSIPLLKILFPV